MSPLIFSLVAAAIAPCFANQSAGPGQRGLYQGSRPLPPAPRAEYDPSPSVQHDRLVDLMKRLNLRYLMISSDELRPEYLEYADRIPLIPDEVTGSFVRQIVDLEVKLARRYQIPFPRVRASTDLLLDLAVLRPSVNEARETPLPPDYLDLFIAGLRWARPRAEGELLPDLTKRFLPNLARHLRDALARHRSQIAKSARRDRQTFARLRGPKIPRPPLRLKPEIPSVAKRPAKRAPAPARVGFQEICDFYFSINPSLDLRRPDDPPDAQSLDDR